jgi:hypothetical protein
MSACNSADEGAGNVAEEKNHCENRREKPEESRTDEVSPSNPRRISYFGTLLAFA